MRGNPNDTLPLASREAAILPGYNVTVTIGRNVGTKPLSDLQWQKFQDETRERVSLILNDPEQVFTYHGEGTWRDHITAQTITEESATFVFVNVGRWVNALHVEDVLRVLAKDAEQDAIAWHYGAGRLARRA